MVDLSGYRLTFDDEFNARSISQNGVGTTYRDIRSEWRFDANSDIGFGHSSFVDSASGYDPFSVQNGALSITAAPPGTTTSGFPGSWQSGLITTQGSFSQTYGYFEIRADFSNNADAWDAFWLLPDQQTPPAATGAGHQELDVVEHYGNNDKGVYSTIHTTNPQPAGTTWQQTRQVYSEISHPDGYHTYGVNWQADKISFYVDGELKGFQSTPSDLKTPMYLLANLAVQGTSTSGKPFSSSIDYIRVYSNAPNAVAVPHDRVSSPDGHDPGLSGATAAVRTPAPTMGSTPNSTGANGATSGSTSPTSSPTGTIGSTSGSLGSAFGPTGTTGSTSGSAGPASSPTGSTGSTAGSTGPTSSPAGTTGSPQTSAGTTGSTSPAVNAPCYCSGTRIRTDRGDIAVEELRVGDVAVTAAGQHRAVHWIGTRRYPELTAPKADRPVRIKADALADGLPARDLLVSPDHALYLDGLFVAAGHLVNGTSIIRGEAVRNLTYWHIELDRHDLLLAENTPAESFLAAPGLRRQFDGISAPDVEFIPIPYAKRVEQGPDLEGLRRRVIIRAGLSVEPIRFGDLQGSLDLCEISSGDLRVAGWARDTVHPDGPVCLDIVIDGAVAAMTLAEVYRPDLAASGVGKGQHGFDIGLEEPLEFGLPHTVEVRRSVDGVTIGAMQLDAAGVWNRAIAATPKAGGPL
ncbi:family 16 glycosylhydrolase [Methylobacterium sp. WL18]|nr:family 16 glycosylhydrolase [Methylobacterium sp. WL18]